MANVGDTSKLLSPGVNISTNDPSSSSSSVSTKIPQTSLNDPTSLVNIDSQLKTGYYNVAGPQQQYQNRHLQQSPIFTSNNYNNKNETNCDSIQRKHRQQQQQNQNGGDPSEQQQTKKYQPKFDDSAIWGDLSMDIRASSASALDASFECQIDDEPASMEDVGVGVDVDDHRRVTSSSSSTSLSVKIKKSAAFRCCRGDGEPFFRWASIKTFCFLICALITVHGALATGYTYSVLTTIEKRFSVNSVIAGFIISSYELGSLLSVVFVSYFGTHGHIPRWVGIGGLVLCLGSFLFSLPHFVAPDYKPPNVNDSGPPVCPAISTASPAPIVKQKYSDVLPTGIGGVGGGSLDDSTFITRYVYILIFAQILLGAGGSPMFTLGTAYIDNHVEKDNAAIYLAFMYVMMAVGPVCGFLLGALLLGEYVDPYKVPPKLESGSPYWVGLWWGGYIICGGLYFLSAFPFFLFPRRLSTSKELSDKESEYGRSWRKIPVSVFNLLTNGVYIVATLNACIELAIVSGFTTFLPKYIETQFNLSPSFSSGLTGVVAVPGACIGIFFGGYVIKRFKMEMKGVVNLILLVNCLALGMLTLFFVFGCKNMPVAGLTVPYDNSSVLERVNLTDTCNFNCQCTHGSDYSPVCGNNGITYVSPCHAGCSASVTTGKLTTSFAGDTKWETRNYTGCGCFTTNLTKPGQAKEGMCVSTCTMLVPFLILLFLVSLAASNNQMPLVLITLRSVAEEEKAFALGLQLVVLRLLSYIPSPILYGAVIDSSCILPSSDFVRHDQTSCLMYDVEKFRIRFSSVSMSLMVVAFSLSLLLWWSINKRYTPFSPPVTMSEIAHRLGDIENLHIRRSATAGSLRSWVSDDSLYSRPRSPRHQKTRSC